MVRVDVTDPADLRQLVAAAVDGYGRLDVLVSNAGTSALGPLVEGDLAGW